MTTIFAPDEFDDVTHDESAGLQTSGTPDTETGEDNNDNDISLDDIAGLLPTLAGLGAPATAIGAARNQVLTFVDDADPALRFRLFDGADSDGADPLLDSELTTLTTTAGDAPITLVRINDTTIFGYANYGEATQRVAFALVLEPIAPTTTVPGGANILVIQYEAIHHPDASDPDDALDLSGLVYVDAVQDAAFDDFSSAAAGQNLWNAVTDTATGIQLLFTGFELGSDTVNTSDFGIGSNNQSIVIGDGIVVDFVKGQTAPTQTSADDLANIDFNERVEGPSGGFTLVQTGGNAANRVGAEVFAYDSSELGTDYHDNVISGASQTIVAIEVWNGNTLVSAWTRADGITDNTDPSVTFAISASNDDGVIIQGLLVDYRVEFSVGMVDADDTGKLDRFSVQNVSAGGQANDTFDLGDIRLGGQEADETEIGSHIRFEDDGPTADATLGTGSVTHDETAGLDADADDTDDAAVAALFAGVDNVSTDMTAGYAQGTDPVVDGSASSYGQDEEGGTTAYSLDIADAAGTDSGLTTTDGVAIYLFKEGDLVVGRIGATALAASTGAAAFAIAIDADSGVLSLAQYASLWHDDETDHDDVMSIASGALFATVTVTDGDDDVDTAQVDIGGQVSFEDDGPTADAALGTGSVTHDETAGLDADADDSDDAAVAALFAGVTNVSTDMTAGYAQGDASVVDGSTSSYGQDEEGGTTAYSLNVSAAGVDSGLDTTDGHNILLYEENGLVVGRISGGDDDGAAAFAVAIDADSGVLSLAQYASLWHDDETDHDDVMSITSGALFATVTVTDGDEDVDTAQVDIGGQVSFEDDGPSADAALGTGSVTHDETAGLDADADDTDDAAVAVLFAGVSNASTDMTAGYALGTDPVVDDSLTDFGQDEEGGTTALSLDIADEAGTDSGLTTTDGVAIFLFKEGELVVGRIGATALEASTGAAAFAVAIDADSGVLSLAQYASLWHDDATDPDDVMSIASGALFATVTVTDGDDDVDTAQVDIGSQVSFEDDGPTADAALGTGSVTHDETAGLDADADDTDAAAVAALFAGVSNVSTDMTAGYAQGTDPVVDGSLTDFGQDEEGGTTALSLDIADEDGTDSGLTTTDGVAIFLFKEDDLVVGRIGATALAASTGAAAFAVAIDADSGVLSLAQYASLWHDDETDHDDVMSIASGALFATVTVTDGDDDVDTAQVDIGGQVSFEDDGPTADAALGTGSVTHDETAGLDADADDSDDAAVAALFAGVSNVSTDMTAGYAQGTDPVVDGSLTDFGQDEEGGTTALSLDIADEDGTDSGLTTTDGVAIFLFKEDDLVVGRIGATALAASTGAAAFAVAIDADSGMLSLAQYASLWHDDATDHDDVMSIASAALFATVTVTDGDEDVDTAQVDIGGQVSFEDDGPTADAALGTGSVTHDETAGLDADADDSDDAAVAALFAGVDNVSSDMTAGYALGSASVVDGSASSYGQDEEGGTTAYSLNVSAAGVDSGLDTTDGHNILLYEENGLVVGRISGGDDDGAAAFAIAIDADSGVLSLAQYASLWHDDATDPDDVMSITSGALFATVTVTDGDDDVDTAKVDIGSQVSFEDDEPSADAALGTGSVTHDESAGLDADADDTDDAAVAALFAGVDNVSTDMTAGYAQGDASVVDGSASSYGQDEEGATTAYSLDVSAAGVDSGLDTTDGHNILLYEENGLVVGRISGGDDDGTAAFAVAIDADSGVLSLAQYASLWHDDATDPDDVMSIANGALLATVTVTDGDDDVATDSVAIGAQVSFQDDGPSVDAALCAGSVTHDETAGVDADADDTTDAAVAALFAGVTNVSTDMTAAYAQGAASVVEDSGTDFGQDEEGGTTTLSLDIADEDGTDSGLTTTDGVKIFLFKDGDLVVGRIGTTALVASTGAAAFAIAIDADSGVLSLAQYASLWHDDATDHDDVMSIASGALFATVTVTDGDDDEDSDSVDIGSRVSFEDDGPSALQPEDGAIENTAGATETGDLDDDLSTFAANFGVDGAGVLRFTGMNDEVLADGAALEDADGNALFSNKVAITLSGFGTNVLTASAGATTVFTMTLDSVTGQYTMEMFAKIDDGSLDFDNFAAGAGNFSWVGVAGDEIPAKDLLVTGGNAGVDKVNSDADDLAIGNQWIDAAKLGSRGNFTPAETIRLDFVDLGINANTGGRTLDTIDDILNPVIHYDVNNVGFTVMQTRARNPVDVRITAVDETSNIGGTDIATDLTTSPAEIDEIISVTIITNSLTDPAGTTYLRSGATEEEVAGVTRLVSRDGSGNLLILWDDNVDVDSVGEGYVIVYDLEGANFNQPLLRDRVFVATDDGFNRLEISNAEAVNSKHAFAIGGVEVGAVGQEIDLAFNGEIVDGDGDANSIGLIGVTVTPEVIG